MLIAHGQVVVSITQGHAVDTVGEAVKLEGNTDFGEAGGEGEGVARVIGVRLPDEEGRIVDRKVVFRREVELVFLVRIRKRTAEERAGEGRIGVRASDRLIGLPSSSLPLRL